MASFTVKELNIEEDTEHVLTLVNVFPPVVIEFANTSGVNVYMSRNKFKTFSTPSLLQFNPNSNIGIRFVRKESAGGERVGFLLSREALR